ncbi:unnamed protein product, partial [Acidithrix sp. C25]
VKDTQHGDPEIGEPRSKSASPSGLEKIPERLVKSTERVRDLGEVFTPVAIVQDMLDLLPADVWHPHPAQTFLEPACGDGNFLVAILTKKLYAVMSAAAVVADRQQIEVTRALALEALASIYGVDISPDNVIGGTPGHEIGARERLLRVFSDWHAECLDEKLESDNPILLSAKWIVERNVQVGNMLPFGADGRPSDRAQIPLVEYSWNPECAEVSISITTLGAVMEGAEAEVGDTVSLFGATPPKHLWTGNISELHQVETYRVTVKRGRTSGKRAS